MLRWKARACVFALFPTTETLAQKYPYVLKYPVLIPYAWLHRLIFRGSKAIKKGVLTSCIVMDEDKINEVGKERVRLFLKLNMLEK